MFGLKKKHIIDSRIAVGLALGGGGARGIAHIGAIKALEELGVRISYIAGTSVGAIIGAAVASGVDIGNIEEYALKVKKKDIVSGNLIFSSSSSEHLINWLGGVIGKDKMFSELDIPLSVVAVDIKSGEEVVIDHGFVCPVCAGSASVPGVFKPVVWEGKHLVDGGLKNNVPTDVVRKMGADVVIAIDVNSTRGNGTDSMKRLHILSSMVGVLMQSSVNEKLKYADVTLCPDLSQFKSTKIKDVQQMIDIGYNAVMDNKEKILKVLEKKPSKRKKRQWLKKMDRQ